MSQQSISMAQASAAPTARKELVNRRAEWGRKAILGGSIMAMIGMVTYCYSTLGGGPDVDLFGSLFENGIVGWTAFVLLVTGVGIWIAGNVALLDEADRTESEN